MRKIIFLGYVPGRYGSFLYHCLSKSIDCFSFDLVNIFNEHSAAHNGTLTLIHKFHDGDELAAWASLESDQAKEDYIDRYSFFPLQFLETNTYYIHRYCVPSLTEEIQRFFTEHKFIEITFTEQNIPRIAWDMARKTISGIEEKIKQNNEEYLKNYSSMNSEGQLNAYHSICTDWVISHKSPLSPLAYEFKYDYFLSPDIFVQEINNLCDLLEIAYPIGIDKIYTDFRKINNF